MSIKNAKDISTAAGFEPTREFPKGFLVLRLNRSAKQPYISGKGKEYNSKPAYRKYSKA